MQRSYVIYATMPWEGPWAVEHNVAHALARRHPVLYVDPPLSPVTPFRYGFTRTTWPQVAAVLDRRVRSCDRLQVFGPLALPPLTHRRMREVSLPLLRGQVRRAVQRAGLQEPIVVAWRSLQELAGAAGESLRVGVVMDHLPAGAALLGRDPADLELEMETMCRAAEVLCVTSNPVQALLERQGWESELLPFGFPGDLAELYEAATEPEEYRSLPRPLLGYTGSIDDRLDFELIVRLADRIPHGSIVFVGAVSPRLTAQARAALGSRANVHLLGVRPRQSLPAYIRYLDCALLPYVDSEWTRHQSPMKVWDYFYAGVPIVGTGSIELRRYPPPLVHYAETADQAIDLVARSLASGDVGREARRSFALENTWDARATKLDALVDEALEQRRPRVLEAA
jgi:hypothetical protein